MLQLYNSDDIILSVRQWDWNPRSTDVCRPDSPWDVHDPVQWSCTIAVL